MKQRSKKNIAYLLENELCRHVDALSVFAPCKVIEQDGIADAVVVRSGMEPFPVGLSQVFSDGGYCFVEAPIAPDSASKCRYRLLRKCAEINALTGAMTLIANRMDKPVAVMEREAVALDMRPGRYYVTAEDEHGQASRLLGPFPMHVQALAKLDRVRSHCINMTTEGVWLRYGTGSFPRDELAGDLNVALLSSEEMASLVPQGLLAASGVKTPVFY